MTDWDTPLSFLIAPLGSGGATFLHSTANSVSHTTVPDAELDRAPKRTVIGPVHVEPTDWNVV